MPRVLLITAGLAALALVAAPAHAADAPDCTETAQTAFAPCTWTVPPCPSMAQPCES
ncbi:MAG TPA: hypothetical protein VER57_00045 [Cyanobium sp.]|nr:hypothetical protein [Cyanobium sp.]